MTIQDDCLSDDLLAALHKAIKEPTENNKRTASQKIKEEFLDEKRLQISNKPMSEREAIKRFKESHDKLQEGSENK